MNSRGEVPGADVDAAELDETRRRFAEFEAFRGFIDGTHKLIRIYASAPGVTEERFLTEIAAFVCKKLDLACASVLRPDGPGPDLLIAARASASGPASLEPARVSGEEAIAVQAARDAMTAVVEDATAAAVRCPGLADGTRSAAAIPLKSRGRVAGVMQLEDAAPGRFGPPLVATLECFAQILGLALENRALHEELEAGRGDAEPPRPRAGVPAGRSEDRYRAIIENIGLPILTTDAQGVLTWANRAAHLLLGYGPGELEGRPVAAFLKKGHARAMFSALRECADGAEVRDQKIEVITRRGEERTVEMSCSPVREEGRLVGTELILKDVTDRIVIEKLKKSYLQSLQDQVIARTAEIKDTQRAAILAIASLAESIDDDTGGHIQRIQHYAETLAEELRKLPKFREEITDEYIELIRDLSPLHDLGKVGIRDYILQKQDKLTSEEFDKMKDHTLIGARALHLAGAMIKRESTFAIAEMIALYHHQKWDGTGYPAVPIGGDVRPLRGDEIPLCARLVALADVYDALTSKRPYKMPFPHETAREMIVAQSGKHFDPDVVQAFLRREEDFIRIRSQFPETLPTPGRPFELPARDRV